MPVVQGLRRQRVALPPAWGVAQWGGGVVAAASCVMAVADSALHGDRHGSMTGLQGIGPPPRANRFQSRAHCHTYLRNSLPGLAPTMAFSGQRSVHPLSEFARHQSSMHGHCAHRCAWCAFLPSSARVAPSKVLRATHALLLLSVVPGGGPALSAPWDRCCCKLVSSMLANQGHTQVVGELDLQKSSVR